MTTLLTSKNGTAVETTAIDHAVAQFEIPPIVNLAQDVLHSLQKFYKRKQMSMLQKFYKRKHMSKRTLLEFNLKSKQIQKFKSLLYLEA